MFFLQGYSIKRGICPIPIGELTYKPCSEQKFRIYLNFIFKIIAVIK